MTHYERSTINSLNQMNLYFMWIVFLTLYSRENEDTWFPTHNPLPLKNMWLVFSFLPNVDALLIMVKGDGVTAHWHLTAAGSGSYTWIKQIAWQITSNYGTPYLSLYVHASVSACKHVRACIYVCMCVRVSICLCLCVMESPPQSGNSLRCGLIVYDLKGRQVHM